MANTEETDDLFTYNTASQELSDAAYARLAARRAALDTQYVSPNDKPHGRRAAR